jgi:hypothetical protein
MQETEVGGHMVMLPECHEDDKLWIAAQMYNITTRKHEGGQLISGIQRYTMLNEYENIYISTMNYYCGIDADSKARRAANIKLRERVKSWRDLRDGVTYEREIM